MNSFLIKLALHSLLLMLLSGRPEVASLLCVHPDAATPLCLEAWILMHCNRIAFAFLMLLGKNLAFVICDSECLKLRPASSISLMFAKHALVCHSLRNCVTKSRIFDVAVRKSFTQELHL